jgi:hypothetical protein
MYRVDRHVHFHHIQECLYSGHDDSWDRRGNVTRTEMQDLECRMRLERVADRVPRIAALTAVDISQIQFNEAFAFSEGASDCKNLSFIILEAVGKEARSSDLQTTVSAQPIHEYGTVNTTPT